VPIVGGGGPGPSRNPNFRQRSWFPGRAPGGAFCFAIVPDSLAAKKITRSRPRTKEELRMRKTLAREQTKTTVIARKLKRSVAAVYQKAKGLGVTLGGGRGTKGKVSEWGRPRHGSFSGPINLN
jgi:hypothetical protein